MRKLLAVMVLTTMVTGCATGIQGESVLGRPESPMWLSTASVPTQIAHFKQICFAYGIKDGTQNMVNCLHSEMRSAKQRGHERSIAASIASERSRSKTINCTKTGSFINCTEF